MKANRTIKNFLHKLKQSTISDDVQPYERILDQTLTLTKTLAHVADAELQRMTDVIKANVKAGTSPDDHIAELYA